jgi:hypothetical protein
MALMPFDSIVLKNLFEGLFIPGLGTRRYAACGKALMDFLPHLIPGNLLSRINAMLAATWCKTNNHYDYLWRVLELTVPGFDLVVAIHMPQWTDSNNIFHFAQTYLLYFLAARQNALSLYRLDLEWHFPLGHTALRLR